MLRVFAADCCPTGLLVQKGLTASLEELPGILAKISFAKSMHWNPEVFAIFIFFFSFYFHVYVSSRYWI
ncbi:hypothetical protein POUND7_013657 [Theobroma cacao]